MPVKKTISIKSGDPLLSRLHFRPYQTTVERGVIPFAPAADEEQTLDILTPWGETLTASAGDLIVYELDAPNDRWPVNADIFERTYRITRPGFCVKRAVTLLAPLTELTGGDADVEVDVYSLEGNYPVRAGDFYLARGTQGEIWAVPKEKVDSLMTLLNDETFGATE
jgi:hypothetical protein